MGCHSVGLHQFNQVLLTSPLLLLTTLLMAKRCTDQQIVCTVGVVCSVTGLDLYANWEAPYRCIVDTYIVPIVPVLTLMIAATLGRRAPGMVAFACGFLVKSVGLTVVTANGVRTGVLSPTSVFHLLTTVGAWQHFTQLGAIKSS